MMSVRAVSAPAMRPRRREASRSRSGGSAVPRAPVVVGPLKGLFNARMRPRGVIQLPRAQWFQPTAFRDFTIYLTFFIMMIISSASPERPRAPDHQHHPHARDGRGAGGEVGAPRDPDGHGSGRLLSVAGVPALRSRRSYLAEPRSVRALDGPRLDAALFDARARGSQGGERQVRAAGPARPDARRHQALPSARQ